MSRMCVRRLGREGLVGMGVMAMMMVAMAVMPVMIVPLVIMPFMVVPMMIVGMCRRLGTVDLEPAAAEDAVRMAHQGAAHAGLRDGGDVGQHSRLMLGKRVEHRRDEHVPGDAAEHVEMKSHPASWVDRRAHRPGAYMTFENAPPVRSLP